MSTQEYIQLLTSSQSRIYAFIQSLVLDSDQTAEVLQSTNVVLWEKRDEFQPGTNFIAWAFRIAQFQVLAHRKKRQSERIVFDDELVGELARVAERVDGNFECRRRLLQRCIEKLSSNQRIFVRRRYSDGSSLDGMAAESGKNVSAVKQILYRARQSLIDCVNAGLAKEMGQ